MSNVLEIFEQHVLTPGVLLNLRLARFISDADVVAAELRRLQSGIQMLEEEEQLALLLPDEYAEVLPLLERALDERNLSPRDREAVLIMRLRKIRQEWDRLTEPGSYVESEIDDWDPAGKYDAVRFSSPPPRGQHGVAAYLERLDGHIAERLSFLNELEVLPA